MLLAETDSHENVAVAVLLSWRKLQALQSFDIVDDIEAGFENRLTCRGCRRMFVGASLQRRSRFAQNFVELAHDVGLCRAEIGVAQQHGEPFGVADRQRTENIDRQVEIVAQLLDDAEILIVLLAEDGEIRDCLDEQLADDSGDAVEKVGREAVSSSADGPPTEIEVAKPCG